MLILFPVGVIHEDEDFGNAYLKVTSLAEEEETGPTVLSQV